MEINEYGPDVWCDFSERMTFTRVWAKTAHCSDCGSIDHQTIGF